MESNINTTQEQKSGKLLEVKDLRVSFFTPAGEVKAVGGISYDLNYDEVMGIVGESGSGKSVEAYSIIGLLQSPGKVIGGSITFEGQDVLAKTKEEMTDFRGREVAMIFQNPMTCLNPVYTVGNQLIEALRAHDKSISKEDASKRAMEMLELVGINNVAKRMKQYPHEPTTALDVTIQAQILELMKDLQKKTHMGIIFITHNLGVVAEICDKVSVMYAGKIVEQGPVNDIFYRPSHPYTVGLLRSMPRVDAESYEPHRGHAGGHAEPAGGVSVRAAVRALHEDLPEADASLCGDRGGPPVGLLAAGAGAQEGRKAGRRGRRAG